MKKSLLPVVVAFLMSTPEAHASEIELSYNVDEKTPFSYGYDKKEEYDIAVRICDPMLTGTTITGIRFFIAADPTVVDNCSAWLTSELTLERINGKNTNKPDICSEKFNPASGMIEVNFSEPYSIPDDGVYVGYSLNVKSTDKGGDKPIYLVSDTNPDGLYIHTSRSQLTWESLSSELHSISPMTIMLEGDFKEDVASISIPSNLKGEVGKEATVEAIVTNYGTSPIESVSYSFSIGDITGFGEYKFENPIQEHLWSSENAIISICLPQETGIYDLEICLTDVNGTPNNVSLNKASSKIEVLPFLPVYRPLIEEYTGLWCRWCPGGMVAMEELSEKYPKSFIGVAYHNNDQMETLTEDNFPSSFGGYPYISINRVYSEDALSLIKTYPSYLNNSTIADIDVDLDWSDEQHSGLVATSKVRFLEPQTNSSYRIAYILLADDLTNPRWKQENAYSGMSSEEYKGEYWETFINGGTSVAGLTFNNVVAYYKDINGVENSVPSNIEAHVVESYEYFIDMKDVVNTIGENFESISTTPPSFKVVAILLECYPWQTSVINCNTSSSIKISSSVDRIPASEPMEIIYYDLNGNKVKNPRKGIYIKKSVFPDGYIKSSKEAF